VTFACFFLGKVLTDCDSMGTYAHEWDNRDIDEKVF